MLVVTSKSSKSEYKSKSLMSLNTIVLELVVPFENVVHSTCSSIVKVAKYKLITPKVFERVMEIEVCFVYVDAIFSFMWVSYN